MYDVIWLYAPLCVLVGTLIGGPLGIAIGATLQANGFWEDDQ